MKHINPAAHNAVPAPLNCSALFSMIADAVRKGSDGSVRHLAPDTPCVRMGRFVVNDIPPSALDPRGMRRIGTLEDGKITFVAAAYMRGYNDTPQLPHTPETEQRLRTIAQELHIL